MIKKIIGYNFFTFFFSFMHIIFNAFFFKKNLIFISRIYIFLLPFSSFLFFICLLISHNIKKNKSQLIICIYILCGIINLFFNIFIFFYLIDEIYNFFLLRIFLNFIFSYFMVLFFRIFFLLK